MVKYTPQAQTAKILNLALSIVESVEYEVPARWVFYQLVQRLGFPKSAYKQLIHWLSAARKGYWNGWNPDTLADDTRNITERDGGLASREEWVEAIQQMRCKMEVRSRQPCVLLVLFEAAAMEGQFRHYLEPLRISSAPFRGDASIPLKSKTAKLITRLHKEFPEKPVRILYFGDYDKKGLSIPISALKDIWQWIRADDLGTILRPNAADDQILESEKGRFQWVRVGINERDVEQLEIAENPDKPGTYQWEALSDEQASQMILGAVARYWDTDIVEQVGAEEAETEEWWKKQVAPILKRLKRAT